MKKLTKTLSLVLVIAMVVSLCVVGASAKTFSDYKAPTDKTATDYTEAIDVMSGVGIIEGMPSGNFEAAGNFNRAMAAKIIAYMQLGVKKAESLSFNNNTAPVFSDVPTTFWAYNYIEYCAQQGIISGYGNGKFGPSDTLTGYQWTKMLLSAVGFGVNKEYNGVNWAINVARDGLKYGVFTKQVDATAGSTPLFITRDVATGMAFNTLVGIPKVTYAALIGDYIDSTGNVAGGATSNIGKILNGINTNGTLAVTVFGLAPQSGRISYNAVKGFNVNGNTAAGVDYTQYGYMAHVWTVGTTQKTVVSKGYVDSTVIKTVGTGCGLFNEVKQNVYIGYCDTSSANYVASIDGYADAAGLAAYNKNQQTPATGNVVAVIDTGSASGAEVSYVPVSKIEYSYVNGQAMIRGNAITLLDEDGDGMVDAIAVLHKVVDVLASNPVTMTKDGTDYVKMIGNAGTITEDNYYWDNYAKAANVDGYKDLVKGDTVLWFLDCTGTYHFAKAASFTGTYTGATVKNGETFYTIKGQDNPCQVTELRFADEYVPSAPNVETTFYTDDFGYLVGQKADTTDYHVFVMAADANYLSGVTSAVLMSEDGSIVNPAKIASLNGVAAAERDHNAAEDAYAGQWYTYTKNADGSYNLFTIPGTTTAGETTSTKTGVKPAEFWQMTSKATYLISDGTTTLYGNANTKIFIQQKDGSVKEYKGILNAPTGKFYGKIYYVEKADYVTELFVAYDSKDTTTDSTADVFFYGMFVNDSWEYVGSAKVYTVNAIVDGKEPATLKVTEAVFNRIAAQPGLYLGTKTSNGVIYDAGKFATKGTWADVPAGNYMISQFTGAEGVDMSKNVFTVNGGRIGAYDESVTKVYAVDYSGTLYTLTAAEVANLSNHMDYLEGALVTYTYVNPKVNDQLSTVVIYNGSYAGVVETADPVFLPKIDSTEANGLTITSVKPVNNELVLASDLPKSVEYTVTVSGTAKANTFTDLTVNGKAAVKADNAGTYTVTCAPGAKLALADATKTVTVKTVANGSGVTATVNKTVVRSGEETPITVTASRAADAATASTEITNVVVTAGTNAAVTTAFTPVKAAAGAALNGSATVTADGTGNVEITVTVTVAATPAP